jgi:hypothetical protein
MAKTKKYKLPKRIAGVKLSKPLRRQGGRVLQQLDNRRGLAAAGLGALAVALAASPKLRRAVSDAGAHLAGLADAPGRRNGAQPSYDGV